MGRTAKNRSDREIAKTIALGLPDVEISHHHNATEMRVQNKLFASLPAQGKVVLVKCAGDTLEQLTKEHPETYAKARGDWLQASLDDIDRATLQALLIAAWLLAAPQAIRSIHETRLANLP
jgi:hypothetical protein